ncbi:MAG TPA: hypothetical protein VH227_01650 [Candidatus Udaeobacter sp.]|jgi:hypothetical protein|nr:hypothetical protein [Candidatus Udaeobacter sp.]
MRDKKKTKTINVRDMKPKKDAKGGVVADVSTKTHSIQNRGTQGHQINRPGRGDT